MTARTDWTCDVDLIVVGGGPGGSTLASLVAMQGHSVLLLEREKFPRYQIGESLLPATVHGICKILGVTDELAAAGFVRKNGAAFRWGTNPEPWIFGFSQAPMLESIGANFSYQVERSKFDAILLNNSRRKGVDVREQHRVENLIYEQDRVVGVEFLDEHGTLHKARSRFVADASGNSSPLYRRVGNRIYSRFFRNVALFCYFSGGKRLDPPNQGNILCEAFPGGWIWYIPLSHTTPNLTSVGAVIANEHISKIQQDPETAMRDFIRACPKINSLLSEAQRITEGQYGLFRIRKDWSYTNERFWSPGIVLIGDAACFIDPVLSTGVHLSTYSALLAARSINTLLRGDMQEPVVFEEFERRYRLEYEAFYNYLVAFYDMHRDQGSYYWEARKVLQTEEKANEAFVRLVAGGATSPDIYFKAKEGIGETLEKLAGDLHGDLTSENRMHITRQMAEQLHAFDAAGSAAKPVHGGLEDIRRLSWGHEENVTAIPLFERGLIPSTDGLHWTAATSP